MGVLDFSGVDSREVFRPGLDVMDDPHKRELSDQAKADMRAWAAKRDLERGMRRAAVAEAVKVETAGAMRGLGATGIAIGWYGDAPAPSGKCGWEIRWKEADGAARGLRETCPSPNVEPLRRLAAVVLGNIRRRAEAARERLGQEVADSLGIPLRKPPTFAVGDRVGRINDPTYHGTVVAGPANAAGGHVKPGDYRVAWDDDGVDERAAQWHRPRMLVAPECAGAVDVAGPAFRVGDRVRIKGYGWGDIDSPVGAGRFMVKWDSGDVSAHHHSALQAFESTPPLAVSEEHAAAQREAVAPFKVGDLVQRREGLGDWDGVAGCGVVLPTSADGWIDVAWDAGQHDTHRPGWLEVYAPPASSSADFQRDLSEALGPPAETYRVEADGSVRELDAPPLTDPPIRWAPYVPGEPARVITPPREDPPLIDEHAWSNVALGCHEAAGVDEGPEPDGVVQDVYLRHPDSPGTELGWRARGQGLCEEHPARSGAIAAWRKAVAEAGR